MSWDFVNVSGPHGQLTEGPAWDGAGVLFTHIPTSSIWRYDLQTRASAVFRSDTNNANGLMFDQEGRLHACEGGGRRVVRYEADGTTTVLADQFEGHRLNLPNDLAFDLQGRLWFTDPWYEGAAGEWSYDPASHKDLDHESVYRLDPQPDGNWSITRVTFDTVKPNGILFSLDYQTLYIAEHGVEPEEPRELRSYPVRSDGSLGPHVVMHDFAPYRSIDGMCLDTQGNIIGPAGVKRGEPGAATVYVFSPSGEMLETHPLPVDRPTNCTFGGPELTTLYVTNNEGHLLQANTERQGELLFPKAT